MGKSQHGDRVKPGGACHNCVPRYTGANTRQQQRAGDRTYTQASQEQSISTGTTVQLLPNDQRQQCPRGACEYKKGGSPCEHRTQLRRMTRVTQAGANRPEDAFGRQFTFRWWALPALQGCNDGKKGDGIQDKTIPGPAAATINPASAGPTDR